MKNNITVYEEYTKQGISKGFTVSFKTTEGKTVKIKNIHGMINVIKTLKTLNEEKETKI